MDGQRFEEWFTKKLLPNLKPRSVVVMDNASYHSPANHQHKEAWDSPVAQQQRDRIGHVHAQGGAEGGVASQNQSLKIAEVEKLTPTALQNVSPENWESYVKHTIEVEEQMWEADGLVDTVLDSIVIDTNGDSDTDTCDEDEEMGCEPLEW
ncbi:hypothetical protein HPB47_002659 [Ixodes persulcatus]|uniref:Uncharacterized protein n=1 Tax=Ixodes persulcatus TaxID=34615 RepID=A0AC60PMA7_IXOPE|nr:hypothetical protein HPB47_002659 [Ixodes persulcatus]